MRFFTLILIILIPQLLNAQPIFNNVMSPIINNNNVSGSKEEEILDNTSYDQNIEKPLAESNKEEIKTLEEQIKEEEATPIVQQIKEETKNSPMQELLIGIKNLMLERNKNKKPTKAFISYAWEDLSTAEGKIANSKLQRYLETLRDDLQTAGIAVFLDIGDMHGDMKLRMKENLSNSDAILTINTPRFKARALATPQTNLGFEYQLTLEKAKIIPYGILPLHYSGSFDDAFGAWGAEKELKDLKGFLIRDCTKLENYEETLVAIQRPLGIIPAIYGIDAAGDAEYKRLIEIWRYKELSALPNTHTNFVGRKDQIAKIENSLHKSKKYVAISGMGGSGKTEAAILVANNNSNKYDVTRLINAEKDIIKSEFELMATKLGIDHVGMSQKELAYNVYSKLSKYKWLLILDNADSYEDIKEYLPSKSTSNQDIIITSLNRNWKNVIQLDILSKTEAVEYIKSNLPDISDADALEVSKTMGYLPLALSHSVAYIKSTAIPIRTYLNMYNEKGIAGINKHGIAEDGERYSKNLQATVKMNMDKVKQKSPLASNIMIAISKLDYDNIPLTWLENEFISSGIEKIYEALKVLQEYSLITPSKLDNHIQVHEIVQSIVKNEFKVQDLNGAIMK